MIEYNFDNILHLQSKFWHLIFFSIKEEIRTEILGQVLHIKRIRREGILFIWFFFFFFFLVMVMNLKLPFRLPAD